MLSEKVRPPVRYYTRLRVIKAASSRLRRLGYTKHEMTALNALHVASKLGDLNVPGFDPHRLRGKPTRYAIKVNGPFRITFEWIDGDAWRVDLEQYH